jgi:hypothetical protein
MRRAHSSIPARRLTQRVPPSSRSGAAQGFSEADQVTDVSRQNEERVAI